MHPCPPGHLPQVPLTAHAVLWCSFQVLSTRSQYEQASGVQILAPEPKQVGVPWAPGGGITGHSQVFLRKLRTNTNTLCHREKWALLWAERLSLRSCQGRLPVAKSWVAGCLSRDPWAGPGRLQPAPVPGVHHERERTVTGDPAVLAALPGAGAPRRLISPMLGPALPLSLPPSGQQRSPDNPYPPCTVL